MNLSYYQMFFLAGHLGTVRPRIDSVRGKMVPQRNQFYKNSSTEIYDRPDLIEINEHLDWLPLHHRWCRCGADGMISGGNIGVKIYFDLCANQRPLDTPNQVRIVLEYGVVFWNYHP